MFKEEKHLTLRHISDISLSKGDCSHSQHRLLMGFTSQTFLLPSNS